MAWSVRERLYRTVSTEAIGVLGAGSTATACLLPGSVADGIAVLPKDTRLGYSVEHPTGEFTDQLEQHVEKLTSHRPKT